MAGRINYLDDDGKERFSRFHSVDISVQGLVSFDTSLGGVRITIPVNRLIKIKEEATKVVDPVEVSK